MSERKRIEQQASDLERRMQEVYENLPIAVFAVDAEHRVTFWNPPLAAMTGIEAASILGTRDCWRGFYSEERPCMANLLVDGLDPEALERFYAGKYRPSGVLPGALEAEDFYPRMAAGKGLWLQFTAAPLRDAAGLVVGAITTLVDITRSKAAEALVLRERNFLETLIEANPTPVFHKATFRNPAGEVAGLIGVVLDVTDLKQAEQSLQDLNLQLEARVAARTDELQQAMGKLVHAEKLMRSMTRAAELISNFKQVAVDQTSSQRRQFELPALVDEIVLCLQPLVDESGCALHTGIDAALTLDSYPGPLGQVLSNLITNALIHGFEASAPGTVAVHARRVDSQRLLITLSDNGRGIDLADQRRIFDPFFTTRLGHGGSGLGLHVAHNIVTGVLGGQIEVRSSPGAGTTFLLNLPLATPQPSRIEWASP